MGGAWRTSPWTLISSMSRRTSWVQTPDSFRSTKANSAALATRPFLPRSRGYATAYLWEKTWARDSALDLIRQFIHEVEEEDEKGRKTGKKFLIFPRYQQLDAVRRLVRGWARNTEPGSDI